MLGLMVWTSAAFGNAVSADTEAIRAFIRHYEATSDYDRYYDGIKTSPPRQLTQMTVGEVMAWQASLKNVASTAAGAYQIIKGTLRGLVEKHGVNPADLFDKKMQDRLADLLLGDCEATRESVESFGNCIAGVWAALPLVSGPNAGKSQYQGVAGNRALTTPENVIALLSGGDGSFVPLPEGGASVMSYREHVKLIQAMLDAERSGVGQTVWLTPTYWR